MPVEEKLKESAPAVEKEQLKKDAQTLQSKQKSAESGFMASLRKGYQRQQ